MSTLKALFLALSYLLCSEATATKLPDTSRNSHYVDTHLHRALQGFLTALEEKQPGRFFDEAWALSGRANAMSFGEGVDPPIGKAFGAPEVTKEQREAAPKVWVMLQKYVDLDARFSARETQLERTVDIWRSAIRISPRFILETEAKIVRGVSERGYYRYLGFRHDMVSEFGFGKDQDSNTPFRQLARAGTRTRITKMLVANLGTAKGSKFKQVLDKYFLEIVGAAVFAHAEASIQLELASKASD